VEENNILLLLRVEPPLLEWPVLSLVTNDELAIPPLSNLLLSVYLVLEVGGKGESNIRNFAKENYVRNLSTI
jgi:hypothetical protein